MRGYSPYYVGQQPGPSPSVVPYDDPSAPHPVARTMSYKDAYGYLVQCMKNLDAAGVPGEELVTLLIWLGINEAAEHEHWSRRKIEDTVAQTIGMSAVRNQPR